MYVDISLLLYIFTCSAIHCKYFFKNNIIIINSSTTNYITMCAKCDMFGTTIYTYEELFRIYESYERNII